MSIIQGNAKQGSTRGFYPKIINGSLRLNDDDSAYLVRDQLDGTTTTWTFSTWVKRGGSFGVQHPIMSVGANNTNDMLLYFMQPSFEDLLDFTIRDSSTIRGQLRTAMKFRDPSAWYHIVAVCDTTNDTESDRLRLYVNGERVTSFNSTPTYPSQNQTTVVNNSSYDMYLSKLRADTATYLDGYMAETFFIDGQALTADDFGELKNGVWVAKDYSGTYGTNGFYLTFEDDTEVEAFNTVLYKGNNTTQSVTGTGFNPDLVWIKARNTGLMGHILTDSVRGAGKALISNATNAEDVNHQYGYLSSFDSDGFTVTKGSTNADRVNNSSYNYVAWAWDAGANNAVTGHSSVTYTGSGTSGTRVSGLPFAPDLLWIKGRSLTGTSHKVYDTVRGQSAGALETNSTAAENSGFNWITSFDNDGFVLGGSSGDANTSGATYVAWAWDAGDSDPVSNTAGSITSTVKTNGDFSIISYTGNATSGATIGHGLSAAPDFILVKNRDDGVRHWIAYHSSITNAEQKYLFLSGTNAIQDGVEIWNDTAPTASVISLGNSGETNQSGSDHICYAWRNVTGKQKFGSYTGDGTSDGSKTITTGFRPGFLMVKRTDSTENWQIVDGSRDPLNNVDGLLWANLSNAESTADFWQFTDTGFKIINSNTEVNANGGTYIYAAFAGSYSDYITDYNTDGSIDSRVKASDTTGFSIVSYKGNGANGATVGHGLSGAPDFVITKTRTQAENWNVQHVDSQRLNLNLTGAQVNNYLMTFNASTVTLTDLTYQNGNGYDMIMYAWKETTGVSKFGSYEGNNTATGPTVTLGWQPALVIIKNADGTGNWNLFDNTRATFPDNDLFLRANLANAEVDGSAEGGDAYEVEFTSTGFIPKASGASSRSQVNGTGTYIYAAFADTREAAFWLDQSGNDNDWQPNNLDHNDTVADSPTNNFATLNPVGTYGGTLSDGNLTHTSTGQWVGAHSTIAMQSGKWYCEYTATDAVNFMVGIVAADGTNVPLLGTANSGYPGKTSDGYGWINNANKINNDVSTAYGSAPSNGDVIMIAFDADNGELYVGKNGTWFNSSNPSTNTSPMFSSIPMTSAYYFCVANEYANGTINFGQQPFKYDPPA